MTAAARAAQHPQHDAGRGQQAAEDEHDRRRRELGHEDEAGAEHADERAGGAERLDPPDDLAGVGDVAQLGLDGQRADRAEQGGGQEERHRGEEHDGDRVSAVGAPVRGRG